ncbi:hypothetical protein [Mycobacterium sp. SMC-4]|uniref:hypothetical protein n=1 Tax=Mycobacterium sp. SMC-4 TaxID=2857059 RepID=UPI003CFEB0B1
MIEYAKFPGLAGVYLEDSYVLGISELPGRLIFTLDAVLTPESPAYREPRQDEQYCYAPASLVFPDVERIEWIARSDRYFTDAAGEKDLGNIDVLGRAVDWFVAEGDWGRVRVQGAAPYVELEG